ncbi:hypothetical protein ALC62_03127 [Cyphomyrmex costatus]|uniref:Uncharacterized protein n=1 Tax=Cyphomyrmex costatus TaxID=456900 RepID=A0A151IM16_9HYME|nr:hypothetical protein ALC62_03127 [Cyphomyrmex costatus]
MDSQSKSNHDELSIVLNESTNDDFVVDDDDEDEDLMLVNASAIGSLLDVIHSTWIEHILIMKNLKATLACIHVYMSKQSKEDSNTTRLKEAQTMKNALLMFNEFLKKKGCTNMNYSTKELHRFLAMSENKPLRSMFMDIFISADNYFEWIKDLKESIKRQVSTVCEVLKRRVDAEASSDGIGGVETLFASAVKRSRTDGLSQYVTKLDNGRIYTARSPEMDTGHKLIRLDIYNVNDIEGKEKQVAVLKKGTILTHYIFFHPIPWRLLSKADQTHASWLMANHHGLLWNDGMVPYRMATRLICEAVVGENESVIVYVKGFEKREWLVDILNNDEIIIETIDGVESFENLDDSGTMRYGKHVKCCALQNVLKLYKWWLKENK